MQARRRRRGYSLLEVVIVCAVLVILATLTYPSLRSMYPYYKVQGAVDAVRSAWAYARARAIEEGRPYRFSVEEQGAHYRIAPDREDYWSGSRPENDPDGVGLVVEQALPAGVRFSLNGAPTALPDEVGTSQENTPASGNWTTAAVFLPDGTARQDVRIVFQIKGARPIALQLRGLTGTVTAQTVNP